MTTTKLFDFPMEEAMKHNNELKEGSLWFDDQGRLYHSAYYGKFKGISFPIETNERPEDLISLDKVRAFMDEKRDKETYYVEYFARFRKTDEGWALEVEGETEEEEGVSLGTKVIS